MHSKGFCNTILNSFTVASCIAFMHCKQNNITINKTRKLLRDFSATFFKCNLQSFISKLSKIFSICVSHLLYFSQRQTILKTHWLTRTSFSWMLFAIHFSRNHLSGTLTISNNTPAWKVSKYGNFLVPVFPFSAFSSNMGKHGPQKNVFGQFPRSGRAKNPNSRSSD